MFSSYVALGDSMSIDFYPAQDAERAGVSTRENLGAASLLFRNDDQLFPEFQSKDLSTIFPKIKFKNLALDGATTEDLLAVLRETPATKKGKVLVTLTIGGNDLLQSYLRTRAAGSPGLSEELTKIKRKYALAVEQIQQKFPDHLLLLTTIFDPTDGTGIMPSNVTPYDAYLPIEYLNRFNEMIAMLAKVTGALLADVHKHFAGHGAGCASRKDFWYWPPSPIEPSYIGASEIRRVWLDILVDSFP